MQILFDPVITEITSLVNQQVRQAEAKKNALIDVLAALFILVFIRIVILTLIIH
jgi:hypothetical protein